jgi:cytosine/adenosine deaminase-related metal-dependent hydrolase
MPRVLIKDALVLRGGGDWHAARADIALEGETIEAVGTLAERPGDSVLAGRGFLAAPGLINAHYHSPLSLLRGTADGLGHAAFMWQNQADTAGRTAQEVYVSALLGGIEMLAGGTTAVMDHFPEQGFAMAHVDAAVRAYKDLGMRATLALRVFDEPYDDIAPPQGLPPALATLNPLTPPALEHSMELVRAAVDAHDDPGGLVRVFPGPSNPSRCSDRLLAECDALARSRGLGVHTHLLETAIQVDIARERYGTTMVQHLDRLGVLSSRLSCAHTIWLEEDDIARLAERGVTVVHNPESNLKVGAGYMKLPAMRRLGVRVALGSDGASTNDNLSLHEAMRLAAILHRPNEPRERWARAADVLEMATAGGAGALQDARLGRIAPGRSADLVLYDLNDVRWTPCNDPAQQLVFSESGEAVHTVFVAGRKVVAEGKPTGIDRDAVLREAQGMLKEVRSRNRPLQEAVRSLI